MLNQEEALFHACMSYCQNFTHVLYKVLQKEELKKTGMYREEWEAKELEMEYKRLNSRFVRLKEAIEEYEKGV